MGHESHDTVFIKYFEPFDKPLFKMYPNNFNKIKLFNENDMVYLNPQLKRGQQTLGAQLSDLSVTCIASNV